jgi:hypothetical protein
MFKKKLQQAGMEMKDQTRVWKLIVLSLIVGPSACILVPVGGDDHHGGGDYHEAHDHY